MQANIFLFVIVLFLNMSCGGGGGGGSSSSSTTTSTNDIDNIIDSATACTANPHLCSLITSTQFSDIFKHRDNSTCIADGSAVYTYANFLNAALLFPNFANVGTSTVQKQELAAFLANISHETTGGWSSAPDGPYAWGLCFTKENGCTNGSCTGYNSADATYPPSSGHTYFGRGALQLSWNYFYGSASVAIYGDKNVLLNNPDLVATDGLVSFKAAIWYWMTAQAPKPSAHDVMSIGSTDNAGTRPAGFGLTINIINGGLECQSSGVINAKQTDRIGFYTRYTGLFGVATGSNLDCANQPHY
jgi:chitinase